MRVFDRIGQYVGQYLPYAHIVAVQSRWDLRVDCHFQADILVRRPLCSHVHQVVYHAAQIIRDRHDLHLTGLDLGEVKDIIDQRQQRLPCRVDIHGVLLDLLLFRLAQDHLVHAEHRIDRCADLVGHVCQKPSLRLICRKRLVPGVIRVFLGKCELRVLLLCHFDLLLQKARAVLRTLPVFF